MKGLENLSGRALFIGAHPDDIELGAGGTVARLTSAGWDILLCILTNEANQATASKRSNEAKAAARLLGVKPKRIIFIGLPDTNFGCNSQTVAAVRKVMNNCKFYPDIVFTHTKADSHNDHRTAYEITLAAFRRAPILSYGIVNSLIKSEFTPKLFVDISNYYDQKLLAISQHKSQSTRINEKTIQNFSKACASRLGFVHGEAFEILFQEGSDTKLDLVISLNDCPFHRFWSTIIGNERLIIIYGVPVYRKNKQWSWSIDKDREGMALLHRAFRDMWFGTDPIEDLSCGTPNAEGLLWNSNILLSGGAVSNSITRTYFNHFRGIRYAIDYSMPDFTDVRIYDRIKHKNILAKYKSDSLGNITPTKDIGALTVIRSPMENTKCLLGCMGIHGFGSMGCYKVLSNRLLLKLLMKYIDLPLEHQGYQILVEYDVINDKTRLLPNTFHIVKY